MNCYCCGKPLPDPVPASGWHPACIRRFFGTRALPKIEPSNEMLTMLAEQAVQKGITVPGVQKKLSLHLSEEHLPRLTIVDHPTGYILKPQVPEFQALPEAEHLVMQMAERAGLSVVPHALVKMEDRFAYITRRVDRIRGEGEGTEKLAMEDFCQLGRRLTADKYRGSYERCANVIRDYSSRPGLDLSELFLRLIFCFLTGNSDMHLKNFSLIETAPVSGRYVLSPAYDLLPVTVIMPEDREEFALTMNSKKTSLRRKDFLVFAESTGIARKTAEAMIGKMTAHLPEWISMCETSFLPDEVKSALTDLMRDRVARLL